MNEKWKKIYWLKIEKMNTNEKKYEKNKWIYWWEKYKQMYGWMQTNELMNK